MSRRQFLERMSVVVSGDRVLDALYQKGGGGMPVLLAPSREAMMEQASFAELCFGFCANAQATLRFNFGGIGASSKGKSEHSLARDLEDLESARNHLMDTLSRRCALVAHGDAARLVGGVEKSFTKIAFLDPGEGDLEAWLNSERKREAQVFLSEHNPARSKLSQECEDLRISVIPNARPGFERGLPQLRKELVAFVSS